MKKPYKLDQNDKFRVVETHETLSLNDDYKLIYASSNHEFHYYSENSEKRVADCSIGHDSRITEFEKKLLFNIIYHLSNLP